MLFSVYTNGISYNTKTVSLLKYEDDMALVAHMTGSDALPQYHNSVNTLIKILNDNSLELII